MGVCVEPELYDISVGPKDQFIIWASDGVWEFISSQEAVTIVHGCIAHGPQHACDTLIKEAVRY